MIRQGLDRLKINSLDKKQLGRFGLYWLKMYLTGLDIKIIAKEGNTKGNELTILANNGKHLELYPKTLRLNGKQSHYAFIEKRRWNNTLSDHIFMVPILLQSEKLPLIYLIQSTHWYTPNSLLVDRGYEKQSLKSEPEWGVNLNNKTMVLLQEYELFNQLHKIKADS